MRAPTARIGRGDEGGPWYNTALEIAIDASMPIRPPVFDPPFNVVRASHVELAVRDLPRARGFYVDCLGYLVSAEDRRSLSAGVEERNHHSSCCARRGEPAAQALGFKVASEDDLDRAAPGSSAAICRFRFPRCRTRAARLRTVDITGMPLDLYPQMDQSERMLQRYTAYQGARIQRIDHINCFTPDVQASYDFYSELGFRLTEYTETDDAAIRSSGRCGCTARATCTTSLSPTAAARGCTISGCGRRGRSTSCICAT